MSTQLFSRQTRDHCAPEVSGGGSFFHLQQSDDLRRRSCQTPPATQGSITQTPWKRPAPTISQVDKTTWNWYEPFLRVVESLNKLTVCFFFLMSCVVCAKSFSSVAKTRPKLHFSPSCHLPCTLIFVRRSSLGSVAIRERCQAELNRRLRETQEKLAAAENEGASLRQVPRNSNTWLIIPGLNPCQAPCVETTTTRICDIIMRVGNACGLVRVSLACARVAQRLAYLFGHVPCLRGAPDCRFVWWVL